MGGSGADHKEVASIFFLSRKVWGVRKKLRDTAAPNILQTVVPRYCLEDFAVLRHAQAKRRSALLLRDYPLLSRARAAAMRA